MTTDTDDWQTAPFCPDWAVHPGEILAEILDEKGLTPRVAAVALGWSPDMLTGVLEGRWHLHRTMAHRLADVFGPSVVYWLRLQAMYDEWRLSGFAELREVPTS